MSKFHQYPEFSNTVQLRYKKAVPCKVAGIRLNPHDNTQRIDFLLASNEDGTFDPYRDVVELYTDQEVRMFPALNRALIESGKLVPYTDKPQQVQTINALSDETLQEIMTTGNKAQFTKRLQGITSWVPIARMLSMVTEDTVKWREELLKARLAELSNN